ncbi:MAG TPA: enoyl-CoA hydratase-related protein [Solirubrobacter sp.]|nr:enoyl-CoA hydratase-related protein [Solirubrobacter sp.]
MSSITTRSEDGTTTIVLDRPDALNAIDPALAEALKTALEHAANDDDTRAVVLTGAGRAFSSGADLSGGFDPTPDGHADLARALHERFHPIVHTIRTMPKPVIASVNGAAAGISVSIALAADLVIAAESAYFLLAFVNIGLVADGGASLLIPERIGFARAAELALLGEKLPAPKALEWGLINRVVSDATLSAETRSLADRLANGPTRSYAGTKRQLNAWLFERMPAQLALEAEIQQELAASRDFAEGVAAFKAKREPRFQGR